jgi:hypothetical protein
MANPNEAKKRFWELSDYALSLAQRQNNFLIKYNNQLQAIFTGVYDSIQFRVKMGICQYHALRLAEQSAALRDYLANVLGCQWLNAKYTPNDYSSGFDF